MSTKGLNSLPIGCYIINGKNSKMENHVYVKPECKTFALAKELLFSTSGEEPVTPGIGSAKENFDDQGDDYFNSDDFWDD